MPAISVRVKTRSLSATGGDRRHNQRIGKQPEYVDASRTDDNSVVVSAPTAKKMAAECLRRRRAAFVPGLAPSGKPKRQPSSMAKDAAISISGIITFSTDAYPEIEKLSPEQQNSRFAAAAEDIAERLGTDLAGLAVHRDESRPHAHFTLYGYGKNGEPVSRKMQKKVLSELQEIGANWFEDLGITRGKKIGERIQNGEPYSKTVNRSVRELHHDLPIELAAAQEKVAEMQKRVTTTRTKLEAGSGNLEKLQKRLSTYEKRLEDRKAEAARLADLAHIPKPKQRVIEKPQPRKLGVFKQEPQREALEYYSPKQMRDYAGKAKAALDDLGGRHERLSNDVQRKVQHYQHATENRKNPKTAGFEALGGELVVRYGLVVNETPKRVSVPPQKPASAAQIGAALYRASRDKNWPTTHFSVSDEVCQVILKMAQDDKRLDEIAFNAPAQQRGLENARKIAQEEAEAARKAATQVNQGDGKTDLEREHERRQRPIEGPDFDNDHGGPSLV